MSSNPPSVTVYNHLPNGIHELVSLARDRQALDECFDYLEQIFPEAPLDQPLLLLLDIREAGGSPLGYLWQRARQLAERCPKRPYSYAAILHNMDSPLYKVRTVALGVLAELIHAKVVYFLHDERDKAIAWLHDEAASFRYEDHDAASV